VLILIISPGSAIKGKGRALVVFSQGIREQSHATALLVWAKKAVAAEKTGMPEFGFQQPMDCARDLP
jgi:hypothetical protein